MNRSRTRTPARRRLWPIALLFTLILAASVQAAPEVYGIELVPWSKKVDDDRYKSSRDWKGTIKHFRKQFAGWKYIKWHREVNLPSVKYIHIENTYPRRNFDGINVYELPGGHVYMYVLEHVDEPEPEDDKPADDKPDD